MYNKIILALLGSLLVANAIAKGPGGNLPKAVKDRDYYDAGAPDPDQVTLGKMLYFDKVLSGNRNISCATCHHTLTWTGDGLSLPVGEGGQGLGIARNIGGGRDQIHERVPRNAPHVFNLGAKQFNIMFHDGRVSQDPAQASGFASPAGPQLPLGLDNVLAAQAMFPVTSGAEMAGQAGENPVADAAAAGNLGNPGGVWEQLTDRLRAIPGYVTLFQSAYTEIQQPADISFVHAANAIAAYEASAFRADNSPFDRYLRGSHRALSAEQKRGMQLFYGKAGCSGCHSGAFQTDQAFHAIAMPQIGPGKGDNSDGYLDGREDFGRERVTGEIQHRFKFRTPSLRNVAATAPYGHAGAFDSLESILDHHLQPLESLRNYQQDEATLPPAGALDSHDFVVMNDIYRVEQIANANELPPQPMRKRQRSALLAFMRALTDDNSMDLRRQTPMTVPSGLPVAD